MTSKLETCYELISAMLVDLMFDRTDAVRALNDQFLAALKDYENAKVA